MEAGAASAAAAEESGQVHQVTSAFFQQQQQQDPGGGQCLMRYHSAPGSLLCSLMPDHSQAASLASSPSTSHQQQQQHHHHRHLDMNSLSSININMSITSNDHINILHEQQQQHHSQQQPSSSNGSVSLSRMGSIETPPQYDHQESYEAVVVPLAFRVQQNELLDHRARASSTAHHRHHPPPPPPPPHHHHHSFIQQQQPFDHIDQPSPYTSSTDHHQSTDNLAAAFAAPNSCSRILKQTKSSADLLSKLVEGMSSRDQSSVHNNNVVNSSSLVNVDQHLHLNQPASAAAVNLVLPLTRSTSDGLSSARVALPNMNDHGTNSSAVAVCPGNDQTSCGGLWDDGFLSMHDQAAAASSGRKRMRDCSEVVEQQRFAEEMVYCDEEQCAMEHPALLLSRHLSLRNELQDAVPCKLRARRGCATHPRSVAERVRRTKISEGIKRLHDLVPSMDKQTNTADMLNHAMEYMKQLKEQLEQMQEEMKKCKEKCQGLCSGDSDKPDQE